MKAELALEASKGLQPLSQIAKRHGVRPIQGGKWRVKRLENAYQVFEGGGMVNAANHE